MKCLYKMGRFSVFSICITQRHGRLDVMVRTPKTSLARLLKKLYKSLRLLPINSGEWKCDVYNVKLLTGSLFVGFKPCGVAHVFAKEGEVTGKHSEGGEDVRKSSIFYFSFVWIVYGLFSVPFSHRSVCTESLDQMFLIIVIVCLVCHFRVCHVFHRSDDIFLYRLSCLRALYRNSLFYFRIPYSWVVLTYAIVFQLLRKGDFILAFPVLNGCVKCFRFVAIITKWFCVMYFFVFPAFSLLAGDV